MTHTYHIRAKTENTLPFFPIISVQEVTKLTLKLFCEGTFGHLTNSQKNKILVDYKDCWSNSFTVYNVLTKKNLRTFFKP